MKPQHIGDKKRYNIFVSETLKGSKKMKFRNGFVSNSSSSSFCILGVNLEDNYWNDEYMDEDEESSDEVSEKIDKAGLDYYHGISEYDGIVVGIHVDRLDEHKPISEIKKELAEKLSVVLNKDYNDSDISFCIDGGYDG
jgi:hypothetical protein